MSNSQNYNEVTPPSKYSSLPLQRNNNSSILIASDTALPSLLFADMSHNQLMKPNSSLLSIASSSLGSEPSLLFTDTMGNMEDPFTALSKLTDKDIEQIIQESIHSHQVDDDMLVSPIGKLATAEGLKFRIVTLSPQSANKSTVCGKMKLNCIVALTLFFKLISKNVLGTILNCIRSDDARQTFRDQSILYVCLLIFLFANSN